MWNTPALALVTQQFALPDYYYGEITDLDGNVIHYVEENDTFTVNLWANEQFGDILLPFSFLTWESQFIEILNLSMPKDMWDYNTNWTHVDTPGVLLNKIRPDRQSR